MDAIDVITYNKKISESQKTQAFQEFYSTNSDFFIYGPSQNSYLMLDKIINSNLVPAEIKKLKLKQIVLETFKETALSELQISIWGILLEKTVWKDIKYSIRQSLIFSALYAKEYLSESISYLYSKYSNSDSSFIQNYLDWKTNRALLNLNMKEINKMYSKLTGDKTRKINYTYYVDELIEQYVPYKLVKKFKGKRACKPIITVLNDESDKLEDLSDSLKDDDNINLQPLPLLGQHGGNSIMSTSQPNIDSISMLLNFDV